MCEALRKHLLPFYILAPVILKFLFEGYGFFFLEEIKKKKTNLSFLNSDASMIRFSDLLYYLEKM